MGINGCNYHISNVGNISDAAVKKDFLHYVIPNIRAAFECIEPDYVKIEVYADSVSEEPILYSHERNQSRIKP